MHILCVTRNSLDSERELFNDDIVYVEASAYAHWTDFLITAKHYVKGGAVV